MIIIVTTLHKKAEALRIGKGLLQSRLVACYNLLPIESAYWWKGEIIDEHETMMFLKTQAKDYDMVSEYIKKESGYEVPDIFSLQTDNVHPAFKNWVNTETDK